MSSYVIDVSKLVEIFCTVDDFCQQYDQWKNQRFLSKANHKGRKPSLCKSEVITILIFYHYSGMKNFQYYYVRFIPVLRSYFPSIVSYTQFLDLISKALPELWLLLSWQCINSHHNGIYYVDSKQLPVCHIKRSHSHRVFGSLAGKGKSSTGWFYGMKLHLVINEKGELINFLLTPAHYADNNEQVLKYLFKDLKGKCFGDKGYLSRFFEYFYEQGLTLITKVRNNMKKLLWKMEDAMLTRKRGVIESVFDILSSVQDISHTRHRKVDNAFAHIFAALNAYSFSNKKPSIQQHFKLLAGF